MTDAGQVGSIDPVGEQHRHGRRSRRWQVAAVLTCPCHLPILLAVVGSGALGGALSRNTGLLFVGFALAFACALWRGFLITPNTAESCPACETARH